MGKYLGTTEPVLKSQTHDVAWGPVFTERLGLDGNEAPLQSVTLA